MIKGIKQKLFENKKDIEATKRTFGPLETIDFKEVFNPIAAIAKRRQYLLIVFKISNTNKGIKLKLTTRAKTLNPIIKGGIEKNIFF